MEVSNLLLAEQSRDDHHETRTQDHINFVAQGTNKHGGSSGVAVEGAVYPSTTLPAIRPLHEDQLFDARPYTNEIDSLTLPEIDWHAITASIHPVESHAHVQNHVPVAGVQAGGVVAKRSGKSGAPIAEVLNQVSPVVKHAQRVEDTEEADDRKRRKIDDTTMRTLPKPAPAAKQKSNNKRHFLPPLLVPLHEPPPDAGLIPSMTTEGIRRPIDKVPSREELHAEQHPQHAGCTLVARVKPVEKEIVKKTTTTNATKAAQAAKSRRARHTWDEEETSDLLRGVAKFGIGNWKKILECSEYKFQSRTAVDLKDRFRTCCPEEYRKVGSTTEKPPPVPKSPPKAAKAIQEDTNQKPRRKKSSEGSPGEKASKFEHKLPDELARLGIEGPFPKAQRRTRRGFTNDEDAAILRGFEKYGAKWTKIQSDTALGLASRSRTDLRDRFRNKFPNKFIETGHKFKQKDGVSRDQDEEDASSVDTARPESVVQTVGLQAPAVQEIGGPQQMVPSLRLLTAPTNDSNFFAADFGDVTPDSDEREGPITLSRNIFDWADQNSRAHPHHHQHQRTEHHNTATSSNNVFDTITTMDQFHINPMVARHQYTAVNLFPQLPLSGILNGPVRLPSAKELVSGLEGEGGM